MTTITGTWSTRHLKRLTGLTDPTLTSAYHGWRRYSPWHTTTRGMPEKNCSITVVEAFRRCFIPCPRKPQRMKFMTYCCEIILISTLSQCISAFQSIQQRPEVPLQTYNARYQSYYELAHEGLTIGSNGSKVSCIHYANSLHGKLGDEMERRFNQRLPKNLQEAFDRAVDFEPRILTKQRIHTRKVKEVNHIDVSSDYQEFEVNEAQHVQNPNYKGKNYDPNYQKNKNNYNNNPNSSYNKKNSHNNNNDTTSGNFRNNKGDYTEIPSNIEVTLKGPVNQDQLVKIKEILKNPKNPQGQATKEPISSVG